MKKENSNYAFIAIGFMAAAATVLATGGNNLYWNTIALCGLMVFLWLTEALPIYVTALFPFVFGMPLGIIDNSQLAASYGNTNVYLFMGGFMLALALEKHNVHKQIAKRIINIVGNSKARLLLGFILSTGLLSMWISNTATALMMLPMGLAIIASMPAAERKSKFSLFLLLSIAYSASVGGMATLVGSPPNLLMASIINEAPYN
ncbi:MAG: SLC13 family permease, partial [Nonlabens sp.]|nr:SLC13 family permease [Nonlabens sp.]